MGSPSVLRAGRAPRRESHSSDRESHSPGPEPHSPCSESHSPELQRGSEWRRLGLCAAVAWGFAGSYWGVLLAVEPAIFAYRECLKGQTADASACQANFHRDWPHYSGNRLSYAALVGLAPIPIVLVVAFGLARRHHRKPSPRPGTPDVRAAQLQAMKTSVTWGSGHPL